MADIQPPGAATSSASPYRTMSANTTANTTDPSSPSSSEATYPPWLMSQPQHQQVPFDANLAMYLNSVALGGGSPSPSPPAAAAEAGAEAAPGSLPHTSVSAPYSTAPAAAAPPPSSFQNMLFPQHNTNHNQPFPYMGLLPTQPSTASTSPPQPDGGGGNSDVSAPAISYSNTNSSPPTSQSNSGTSNGSANRPANAATAAPSSSFPHHQQQLPSGAPESQFPPMGLDVKSLLSQFGPHPSTAAATNWDPRQQLFDPFAYAVAMQQSQSQSQPPTHQEAPSSWQQQQQQQRQPVALNMPSTTTESDQPIITAFHPFSSGSFPPPTFFPAPPMNMAGPPGQMDPMAFFTSNPMGPSDPTRPPARPPSEFWNSGHMGTGGGGALPTPMESMESMAPPPSVPKAKSASPPASDAFAPGSIPTNNARAKPQQRDNKGTTGPMRRGRARAATLDGTPKDLAMRRRLNITTKSPLPLLEEDAKSRIQSETSLAHKLTLHAKDMAKAEHRQLDVDQWNILQPDAFDNVGAVMAQLQMRQQARLIRQASQPPNPLFPPEPESTSAAEKGRRRGGRKKNSSDPNDPSKVPHNTIERRYRDNINDRIATLRAAVPALSNLTPKNNGGSTSLLPRKPRKKGEPEDLVDGVSAATKLNKATILGKATEYIHHLKKRETELSTEAEGLKELIRSLQGGEDVLIVWMHEMDQTRREREQEKARLEALMPIQEEDHNLKEENSLMMDDLILDTDDEDSSGSPSSGEHGSQQPAGSYVMAAFLGLTLVGTTSSSSELYHPNVGTHPGAQAASASHQLLKRAWLVSGVHHYDHIPLITLVVEVARFVSFVACILFVLYPAYRTLTKHASTVPLDQSTKYKAQLDQLESVRRRRSVLDSELGASASSPTVMVQALRRFLGAPSGTVGAGTGLLWDLAALMRHKVLLLRAPKLSDPPTLVASPANRIQADVWIRLLEAETAWGAFAQRSLTLKAHTIAHVALIAAALDSAQVDGHHDAVEDANDTDDEGQEDVPARIHQLLALAIGRLGSPTHPVGAMMRKRAHAHWSVAQASRQNSFWLKTIVSQPLERALALCPAEADASVAAQGVEAEMRTYLSSPLLGLNNTMQMASLYRAWIILFPSIIATASPTTFGARVRREREMVSHSLLDQEENLEVPYEQVSSPGGLDVNSFLREFFRRQQAGLVATDLTRCSGSGSYNNKGRIQIQSLLDATIRASVPGTPAYYLDQITLATWSFLSANHHAAQVHAQPLWQALQSDTNLLGARLAAVACVELILGQSAVSTFPGTDSIPEGGLEDDKRIFALVTAGLQWLLLLREMSTNKAVFQAKHPGTGASTLLDRCFALRRTLAGAHPPQSVALTTALGPDSSTRETEDDDSLFSGRIALTLTDAKEAVTDVLADLCRFLGQRASNPSTIHLAPAGEQGLVWIAEESDSGADLV